MNNKTQVIETLINDGGSAKFAQMIAEVEQKQLKTGNPFAKSKVTKLVSYNMLLNANYANMVNNRLAKEGKEANFTAKENWFQKVNDSFNGSIVAKKSDTTELYLLFACNTSETLKYYIDGIEASESEIATIKQFRPKTTAPTNQGTDEAIIVRTVKMDNIKLIKCGVTVMFG